MATVNYSVPEEIKKRFNKAFAHENKSHVIAELMTKAVEERERMQQRAHAIDLLLKLRAKQKPMTNKIVREAREKGRP